MSFRDAVRSVLGNFVGFGGRARRSEFWWFVLFALLVRVLTTVVDGVVFGAPTEQMGPAQTVAAWVLLLPSLAVAFRRLHDVGRSGGWVLLFFVPVFGWLVLAYWWCQDSQEGGNRFGPDPKGAGGGAPWQGYGPQPSVPRQPSQPGQDPLGGAVGQPGGPGAYPPPPAAPPVVARTEEHLRSGWGSPRLGYGYALEPGRAPGSDAGSERSGQQT